MRSQAHRGVRRLPPGPTTYRFNDDGPALIDRAGTMQLLNERRFFICYEIETKLHSTPVAQVNGLVSVGNVFLEDGIALITDFQRQHHFSDDGRIHSHSLPTSLEINSAM